MKKYFFGISAIVLAIIFSAFTSKPKPSTVTDLVFIGSPTVQGNVQDLTKYQEFGTHVSGYTCANNLPDQAACKLLNVDEKYTHDDGTGTEVLNTTAVGGNPDNEPRISGITAAASEGNGNGVTYYIIDAISYTDASPVSRNASEDTKMQNGAKL